MTYQDEDKKAQNDIKNGKEMDYLIDEIRSLLPSVVCNVESNCGSIWFDDADGKSYYVSIGECDEDTYQDKLRLQDLENEENELEDKKAEEK